MIKIIQILIFFFGPFFLFGEKQESPPSPSPVKNTVIFIMGGSCSGKSTIAHQLKELLQTEGNAWDVIDFDNVGESLENVVAATHGLIEKNINVIIDTNTYEDWMLTDLEHSAHVLKVLIYAPLKDLLIRDEKRTAIHHRNIDRAWNARLFVIESHEISKTWQTDLQINTTTEIKDKHEGIKDCCYTIINTLMKRARLKSRGIARNSSKPTTLLRSFGATKGSTCHSSPGLENLGVFWRSRIKK